MTETEERILEVWKQVFGREDFGIDDNFFLNWVAILLWLCVYI